MPVPRSSSPCSTLVTILHSAIPCFSACIQHRPLNAFCLLSPSELLLTFHFMSFHFMKFRRWKLPWTQWSLTLSLSSFVLPTTIETEFPFWIDFYVQAARVFFPFQACCTSASLTATLDSRLDSHPHCSLASDVLPQHLHTVHCLLSFRF